MKKKVAIIGVTGAVGQEFVLSLKDHPWFEVTQIAASERSAEKTMLMQLGIQTVELSNGKWVEKSQNISKE